MSLVAFVRRPDAGPNPELLAALRAHAIESDIVELERIAPDRLADVRAAVVDGPSAEQLARLPQVAFVQSTWAGVEEVVPEVPDHVVVARMIDPRLAETMTEAVLAWVLYLHRDMPRYRRQQEAGLWKDHPLVAASDRRVGIAGLGVLGAHAAAQLVRHGFSVAGWSRSRKSVTGVESFHGDDGLAALLRRSDIVVNLLPHTSATIGIFDAIAFASMPSGSSFVNFGRGSAVVDDDLLDALDAGRLAHAVLDVFRTEPLPPEHRYWSHESVSVLPHITGPTTIETAAEIAVGNVERFLSTGRLPHDAIVDRSRGY